MKIRVVAQISRNDNYDRGEDASLMAALGSKSGGLRRQGLRVQTLPRAVRIWVGLLVFIRR